MNIRDVVAKLREFYGIEVFRELGLNSGRVDANAEMKLWEEMDSALNDEAFFERARTDLAPKMDGSMFVISLVPRDGEIDPKIAIETGYMVLLDKPIIVVVDESSVRMPGLERIAHKIITLTDPITSDAGREQLQDGIREFKEALEAKERLS